jgi:PIN domain nuclease of toxin-antitoxin system
MLAEHGRLIFDRPVSQWVRQALARERVQEAPLTAQAAAEAALLPRNIFPGDPADRFIYATARLTGAGLISADQRLRRFDPALTIW